MENGAWITPVNRMDGRRWTDIWFRSVRHVEGVTLGDKRSLAAAAAAAIETAVAMRGDSSLSKSA